MQHLRCLQTPCLYQDGLLYSQLCRRLVFVCHAAAGVFGRLLGRRGSSGKPYPFPTPLCQRSAPPSDAGGPTPRRLRWRSRWRLWRCCVPCRWSGGGRRRGFGPKGPSGGGAPPAGSQGRAGGEKPKVFPTGHPWGLDAGPLVAGVFSHTRRWGKTEGFSHRPSGSRRAGGGGNSEVSGNRTPPSGLRPAAGGRLRW